MNSIKATIAVCVSAVLSIAIVCAATFNMSSKSAKYIVDSATATSAQKVIATQQTTVPPTTVITTSLAVTEPTTADVTTTAQGTTAVQNTTTTKKTTTTTKKATTTTKKATTTSSKLTSSQIIANYNTAINKVISSKAGYTKVRTTTLNSLEGGSLLNNKTVKNAVSDFLGVGSKTSTNDKGKAELMSKAGLTASDVSNATYSLSDGKYTYTITLKNGSSSASKSSKANSSPVDKSGILVGTGDRSAYDHKCAENLYSAINNTSGASVESITEKTSSTKLVAVVDASTGKLTSLTVNFDYAVSLTNTKYILTIKSANGTATTSVKFSDFKW